MPRLEYGLCTFILLLIQLFLYYGPVIKKSDMDKIDIFIEELAQAESNSILTNVYAGSSLQNEICRHNLSLYFHYMLKNNSHVILVGEAPGYRGCRLSGIPFTCEDMFTQEWLPDLMGINLGYRIFSKDKPERELSALTVWPKLKEWYNQYGKVPLLWNICPFHPHKENNDKSNRTPYAQEIMAGKEFLIKLLDLFEIKHIGSIGRKAEKAIKGMKHETFYLRHPAHNGSNVFGKNIEQFMYLVNDK